MQRAAAPVGCPSASPRRTGANGPSSIMLFGPASRVGLAYCVANCSNLNRRTLGREQTREGRSASSGLSAPALSPIPPPV